MDKKERNDKILELRASGMTIPEIARQIGWSTATVYFTINRDAYLEQLRKCRERYASVSEEEKIKYIEAGLWSRNGLSKVVRDSPQYLEIISKNKLLMEAYEARLKKQEQIEDVCEYLMDHTLGDTARHFSLKVSTVSGYALKRGINPKSHNISRHYQGQFNAAMETKMTKEVSDVVKWIGGLISTDGCVTRHKGGRARRLDIVSSVEKEWVDQVRAVCERVLPSIRSVFISKDCRTVYGKLKNGEMREYSSGRLMHYLQTSSSFYFYCLIRDYPEYMMARKLKILSDSFEPIFSVLIDKFNNLK